MLKTLSDERPLHYYLRITIEEQKGQLEMHQKYYMCIEHLIVK